MMTPPPRAGGLADSLGALHRLQRLRALLGSEGLDALCLIGGVDGRPAAGSGRIAQGGLSSSALAGEALGWLLGALSGRSLAGGATAEVFEEVVLVLTPTHVRLYLPRNAWIALGPRLAMWDNLQLWLPPTGAQDDFELLEEHKARSFVQMLCGVGSLGVCLDTGDARAGAASTVESWPLVQAFALSQFEADGGGSFLTTRIAVSGVAEAIWPLLSQLDAPSLKWLITEEASRLRERWLETEKSIESAVCRSATSNVAHRVSEAELAEPVLTYAAHGEVQADVAAAADGAAHGGGRLGRTRLLIGSRAQLVESSEGCTSALAGAPGGCEREPRHLLLEAAEAAGPLYACRTVFLGSAVHAPPRAPSMLGFDSLVADEGSEGASSASLQPVPSPVRRGPARGVRMAAAGRFAPGAGEDADAHSLEVAEMQGIYSALASLLLQAVAITFSDTAKPARAAGPLAAFADAFSAAALALSGGGGGGPTGTLVKQLGGLLMPRPLGAHAPALSEVEKRMADALRMALGLRCDEAGLSRPSDACLASLHVVLEPVDLHGAPPAESSKASVLVAEGRCLLRIRASLGLESGTVAVGETVAADGLGGIVVLSDALPRYSCFRAPGVEAEAAAELLAPCERMAEVMEQSAAASAAGVRLASALADGGAHPLLGKLLCPPLEGCALVVPGSAMLPPLAGTLYALEYGLLLRHPHIGALIIRFDSTGAAPTSAALLDTSSGDNDTESAPEDGETPLVKVDVQPAGAQEDDYATRHALDTPATGGAASMPLLLAFGWDAAARITGASRAAQGGIAGAVGAVTAALAPPPKRPSLPFTGEGGGIAAVIGAAAAIASGERGGQSGSSEELVLAMVSATARRSFLREVLPAWKSRWEGSVTRYRADGIASIADAATADAVAKADEALVKQAVAKISELSQPWPRPVHAHAAAARARGDARDIALASALPASPPPPRTLVVGPPLDLVAVVGLPGSGVHEAADALVAATATDVHWRRAKATSIAEVATAVSQAATVPCTAAPSRREVVLLEFCGFSPMAPLLAAAVMPAPNRVAIRVCAAACVIHAGRALERTDEPGSGRCAAGLLEQAAAGFCQTVLLAHCGDISQDSVRTISHLIAAANPLAAVARARNGAGTSAAGALGPYLSVVGPKGEGAPTWFDVGPQAYARAATIPGWPVTPSVQTPQSSPKRRAAAPIAPLADHELSAYVSPDTFSIPPPPEPPLMLPALRAALAPLFAATVPSRRLLHVKGVLRAVPAAGAPAELIEIDASVGAFYAPSAAGAKAVTPLVIAGGGESRLPLARALLSARDLPVLQRLAESLPQDEVQEIEAKLGELRLPDGWFYDGSAYISEDGARSRSHPGLEAAIKGRLSEVNAASREANAAASAAIARADAEGDRFLAAVARGE